MLLLGRYHGLEHRKRMPTDDGIGSGSGGWHRRAGKSSIHMYICTCACTCTPAAAIIQVRLCSAFVPVCLSLWSCILAILPGTVLARLLLQARRRRRTDGAPGACASRVCSSAALHLAWLLVGVALCFVCEPRLRLRIPGVSPLTARARLLTRCYCWLAVGTKAKRPIYRSWLDRSFAGVLCLSLPGLLILDLLHYPPLLLLSVDTYIPLYTHILP